MQIEIELLIESYKEELARVTNENIVLKAKIKQIQNDLIKYTQSTEVESGDEE